MVIRSILWQSRYRYITRARRAAIRPARKTLGWMRGAQLSILEFKRGTASARRGKPPQHLTEPAISERFPHDPQNTPHLRLPGGRPIFFRVLVLVGACKSGTVWAGLCLTHHHQDGTPSHLYARGTRGSVRTREFAIPGQTSSITGVPIQVQEAQKKAPPR